MNMYTGRNWLYLIRKSILYWLISLNSTRLTDDIQSVRLILFDIFIGWWNTFDLFLSCPDTELCGPGRCLLVRRLPQLSGGLELMSLLVPLLWYYYNNTASPVWGESVWSHLSGLVCFICQKCSLLWQKLVRLVILREIYLL